MVGGPSCLHAKKSLHDKTHVGHSLSKCKSSVAFDASKLRAYSMCQAMPTGHYERSDLECESCKLKPRPNETTLKIWYCCSFRLSEQNVKWRAFTRRAHRRRLMLKALIVFMHIATFCLMLWEVYNIFVPVKKLFQHLNYKQTHWGVKRELGELRKQYVEEKGNSCVELYDCDERKKTSVTIMLSIIRAIRFRGQWLSKENAFWKTS